MAHGGAMARWRRLGPAACRRVVWNRRAGVRRREEKEKQRPAARARNIYDKWAPRFSLTPVKPLLWFRTPVDCIGAVHPRLQQKII